MENIVEQIKEVISSEIGNLRNEFKQDINDLRNEFIQKMDDLRKEILDRQFVFEEKYGTKIDITYEYILGEQQKNQKNLIALVS